MGEFRVWAPSAQSVSVVVDDDDVPMVRASAGWWTATPVFTGEVDYGFRIDDGPVRPDPRSRRQPHGVHERSRTFDPAAYEWRDTAWTGRHLSGSVIYELHIGTFTPDGTLDAAIERLDYLVELGVGFVEILPVNAFNGPHNWGYDGVLWYAVHEPYGGPTAYQRLVDACHLRDLGVVQDVVYNHLGPAGNYLPEFGPYLRHDKDNTWGASVNLDGPGSDEVRRYIIDNAQMWFDDYHVDALRLDAVHALVDTRAAPLLEELAIETASMAAHLGRPLTLIAESDLNDPRLYTARSAGGYGLGAAWNDDAHHAIHVAVTGETAGYYADFASLGAIAKVLRCGYFHNGTYSSFRERHHGRPINTTVTEASRLVAFLQDHDQVGNRAAGDRINAQAGDKAQAIGAVLLLTSPFTPMLWMGEEWAASTPWQFFTSHPEPELAEATRQGRLDEFARHGWDPAVVPDPQDPETFTRSKLQWDEIAATKHQNMLDLYRQLLELRRSRPELTNAWLANVHVDYSDAQRWLTVHRGSIVVAVNFADDSQVVSLPMLGVDPSALIASVGGAELNAAEQQVSIPAQCAVVIDAGSALA